MHQKIIMAISRVGSLGLIITLLLNIIVIYANNFPENYDLSNTEPGISKKLMQRCPLGDGFDFPVGKPNARRYYNAQKFTRNNHLGDDWNGLGGGNTDLHDPVYAVANGIVVQSKNFHGGWGRVVRILHNIGSQKKPKYVESLYAHMRTALVKPGRVVKRGQKIGTIGNANGVYWAHLHLELRVIINKALGNGYNSNTHGFTNPTTFIKQHRPR
ncbi:hypothetical protein MNBD_GAMMA12-211 [hydrothermal vent metagenome]|uniref:M23ase beta-sheet core domain-containing protein n=1 Tax=hydrothermal vent metagenome TaxID=652676 RepID=A0A3B0YED4_9ZZZZ